MLTLSHSWHVPLPPPPQYMDPLFSTPKPQTSLSLSSLSVKQKKEIKSMDMYGSLSNPPDCFRIDDLLDFSNYHLTTATPSTDSLHQHYHLPPPQQHPLTHQFSDEPNFFTNFPSVPSDEAAELEWLSQIVDDTTSFHDIPLNQATCSSQKTSFLTGNNNYKNTKSPHVPSSSSSAGAPVAGKSRSKRDASGGLAEATGDGGVRRCSHCASEKTPQWRTGPMGPKTLCNACGVRFKSGRLVPEYRPASSPTFVLTQHSNSHRKVMELRRQKELLRQQQQHHDYKVC